MTSNFDTVQIHITDLNAGDTIIHGGLMRTVCSNDIKKDGFMGVSVFGDSYRSGHKPVELVVFKKP